MRYWAHIIGAILFPVFLASCAQDTKDLMLEAFLRVNLPYFEDLTIEEWGSEVDSMFNPRAAVQYEVFIKQKTLELTQRNALMWDEHSWSHIDSLWFVVKEMSESPIPMEFSEAVDALEHPGKCMQHPTRNCLGQTVRYHCNGLFVEDIVFYNEEGRIANLFSLMNARYTEMKKERDKFFENLKTAQDDITEIKERNKLRRKFR